MGPLLLRVPCVNEINGPAGTPAVNMSSEARRVEGNGGEAMEELRRSIPEWVGGTDTWSATKRAQKSVEVITTETRGVRS